MKVLVGLILLIFTVLLNSASTEGEQNEGPQEATKVAVGAEKVLMNEETDSNPGVLQENEHDGEVQQDSNQGMQQSVTIQNIMNSRGVVRHGDTIALQTFVRNFWASCAGRHCGRSGCPRMHMAGHDWTRCWGEVFQIFRANGPGIVRVGDWVGLYYPRESGKWLGCPYKRCGKYPCPGYPSSRYGFAHRSRWRRCGGEIFRIYAKNKRHGNYIRSSDDVAFYYVAGRLWLAQGYHGMTRLPCLGRSLPPNLYKYDGCVYETFTLWKKKC